jgi:hypothetical protein
MPFNLLKIYNELLDFNSLNEFDRKKSLYNVFLRDFVNSQNLMFQSKKVNPTPAEGIDTMERLFSHLTTVVVDKKTKKREFEMNRSLRLHWLKYHLDLNKNENILVFTVEEYNGKRTYIYDIDEFYVVVLEPMRNNDEYYLLTAFYLEGKDKARDKIFKKYKKRLL